jgi:hypothetical protein
MIEQRSCKFRRICVAGWQPALPGATAAFSCDSRFQLRLRYFLRLNFFDFHMRRYDG